MARRNGLWFGTHGTILGHRPFPTTNPPDSQETSIEIWLQPRRAWGSGTVLAFYPARNLSEFTLRQSLTDLLLETEIYGHPPDARGAKLYVHDVFRRGRPVFITLTSDGHVTYIYLDGVLTVRWPGIAICARQLTGQLVVGDSPLQPDSWSGELLGLAVYYTQLKADQVVRNYIGWIQNGRPEISEEERNIALYTFDEHEGRIVRDKAGSGLDLEIPEHYLVLDKIVLEPFWTEFDMSWGYWRGDLKNIVGFVPFGFCFCAYLVTLLPIKRATLVTVALGALVSLTIELLQAFLPTRDSGTTDIITNTLGTWIGAAAYSFMTPTLVRLFPWLPLQTFK